MLFRRSSTCLLVALLTGGLWGCTSQATPSTPAERAANPDSVTKDNPGGDAINPVDAALERLLNEKLGRKIDKYETIEPAFSDTKNWKRIRFFGYKTRGGFRYGKDPSIAAAVLYYWESEDDAPTSCIEHFAVKAQRIADVFDLEVGEMDRSMADHRRGVEAVDWPAWEAEWEAKELERIAQLKERQDKMRERREQAAKRRATVRKRVHSQRLALALRRTAKADPDVTSPAASPAESAVDETPKLDGAVLEAKPRDEGAPGPASDTEQGGASADGAVPADPEEIAKQKRIEDLRRRVAEARKRRAERLANMTPEERKALEERRQQAMERRRQAAERREQKLVEMMKPRPAPLPKDLGVGDMPFIRTSGEFTTLFNRDRYLGAMVAYDSWPGTCLVQGFAVKVGSDEALAEKVLDRWLTEMAPILRWKRDLREQPEIKDR
ncbi:MAG: hypothetical protein RIF41_37410 [Polyangiaceae bacterium]